MNTDADLLNQGVVLQDQNVGTNQFLTFMLGKEEYGVDILNVQEIRSWESATSIPNTPDYVLGVINLRGLVVPIIDLRKRYTDLYLENEPDLKVIPAQLDDLQRTARRRLLENFTPTGRVGDVKIVSLHTDKDGLVIVENESEYAATVPPDAAPRRSRTRAATSWSRKRLRILSPILTACLSELDAPCSSKAASSREPNAQPRSKS